MTQHIDTRKCVYDVKITPDKKTYISNYESAMCHDKKKTIYLTTCQRERGAS
jgi:hypothetical protein